MNKKLNIAFVLAFCILATALYLVVFASGGIATSQADDSVEGIKPGKRAQAADFTLLDVDGRRVSLSDYRGKVVFLNFWATWCNPCRAEFPSLAQMAKRFEGKDFELLTISIDEGGRPAVEAFFRQMGMSLPHRARLEERGGTQVRAGGRTGKFPDRQEGSGGQEVRRPLQLDRTQRAFADRTPSFHAGVLTGRPSLPEEPSYKRGFPEADSSDDGAQWTDCPFAGFRADRGPRRRA